MGEREALDHSTMTVAVLAHPLLILYPDAPESLSSDHRGEPLDSDEALALRMQQELDREAAQAQTVDLEDGGLFFCQICHRDLSHMTPEGRTQHLNRFGHFHLHSRHLTNALKTDL